MQYLPTLAFQYTLTCVPHPPTPHRVTYLSTYKCTYFHIYPPTNSWLQYPIEMESIWCKFRQLLTVGFRFSFSPSCLAWPGPLYCHNTDIYHNVAAAHAPTLSYLLLDLLKSCTRIINKLFGFICRVRTATAACRWSSIKIHPTRTIDIRTVRYYKLDLPLAITTCN